MTRAVRRTHAIPTAASGSKSYRLAVVVTQDIGLADIVLGRGARAIGVRGRIYNPLTIDSAMFIRHEEKKLRRAGGRTSGPAAFTEEDRDRFRRNLASLVTKALEETETSGPQAELPQRY